MSATYSNHPEYGDTYRVCGISLAALTPSASAAAVLGAAENGISCQVHLCNAYTLSLVDGDEKMRHALLDGDLNLPDGAPVAWMGRRKGTRGPVRGPELMREVIEAGRDRGVRHYLYGGADGVAQSLASSFASELHGVQFVGVETPPWDELSDEQLSDLASRVARSGANILWIGLGTPKQDYLVHRLGPLLPIPIVPIGAAFDFLSGAKSEAPRLWRGSGLEWLYRLATEPRRLWRRYLLGHPRFLVSAIRHGLR